jgi:isoleucyl-tRNA synthetase
VRELILAADGNAMKAALDSGGVFVLADGSERYEITSGQVTFVEQLPEGVCSAPMQGGTVYVDTTLSPDLEAEGYAREIIRRFQEMRRQLDLRVEDFVRARACIPNERICRMVAGAWEKGIKDEIRAVSLEFSCDRSPAETGADLTRDWDVEGVQMTLSLSRAMQE